MAQSNLDPRLNAYRPDLADERLQGRVAAQRFVAGTMGQIIRPAVGLRGAPDFDKPFVTEAVLGERVLVFDTGGHSSSRWAWIQQVRDGYVGYVPVDCLSLKVGEPTHRVSAIGTWLYPRPDIKAPALAHLPMGSEIRIRASGERFSELETGEFIIGRHISELGRFARDFVAVAERFLGTPYLWGGRTRLGLDCSGLLQVSLEAAGVSCPRDSDMQQASLGENLADTTNLDVLDRGDLVFWPGHVGIMSDGVMLLHANAHHMAVVTEPLVTAVDRIARSGSSIAAIKRLASRPSALRV